MATEAFVNARVLATPPPAARRRGWTRPLAMGVALAMTALLAGDRGGRAAAVVQGIDPLEILDLQVKPNVVFVVDTSQAMGFNPEGTLYLGGDDPHSRLYQTKQALREVLAGNDGKANFGIIGLNANQAELALARTAPMIYVSADASAATWAGKFNDFDITLGDYDGNPYCGPPIADLRECSNEINDGLNNEDAFASPYQGRHYMRSRLLRNNVRFTWSLTGLGAFDRDMTAVTTPIPPGPTSPAGGCPPPPAGLLGDDDDEFNDGTEARACFQIENAEVPGEITTYYLTSATYGAGAVDPQCDGIVSPRCLVTPVPACTAGSNVSAMLDGPLRTQLPLDAATGLPTGVPVVQVTAAVTDELVGLQPNAGGGMQLGRSRPLDNALRAALEHYNGTVFPNRPAAVAGLQKNFVIVIASGADDTGANPAVTASTMRGGGPVPGANDITTLVVTLNGEAAFPTSADRIALDALQSAGTLGRLTAAFPATSGSQLKQALGAALAETLAAGQFSTESSITESIFEYAAQANTVTPLKNFNPLDPASRYGARVPTLLQSSFDMPGFLGHLKAFQSPGVSGCPAGSILRTDANGRPTCELWDAGVKLRDRVWGTPATVGMCPGAAGSYAACSTVTSIFAEMRGGDPLAGSISTAHPTYRPALSARIQRRIFTTGRRGVFAYQDTLNEPFGPARSPGDAQCPVPLWPPTQSASVGGCTGVGPVAPVDDSAGILDDELGIASMTFAELQSRFGACLGAGAPAVCSDPTLGVARARREARETILAFLAGAELATSGGVPTRRPPAGDLLYRARAWPLSESTLGVPAVVPPPLEAPPVTHTAEYQLYRDGVRTPAGAVPGLGYNPVASGFGLRNPDKNAGAGIGVPSGNNADYEPLMTVVYHISNDMVHAFRGGPCPAGTCGETGGDELWGFVPNDQLDKLKDRMRNQGRSPHTYMLASPVRFSDVFVPGDWDETAVTGRRYDGRWRTLMVFGRGIAGKSYTALDITAPGQFTRTSLDTLPPFAIWSRGNPDTQDGTPTGAANSATDPTGDEGASDLAAYARMGETWSVPAMSAVNPDDFSGKQFMMFMGSGYSTGDPNEGKTFYAVDALTGDVIFDPQVPDSTKTCNVLDPGETCPVPNALVANAAAYIPSQLVARFVGNPAASTASLVYVGDLHGRMWKFLTNAGGVGLVKVQPDSGVFSDNPDQPIGTAVALLNLSGVPHVYWETGNDRRVIPPDPFKFVAVKDLGADIDPTLAATGLFVEPLDGALLGFRGTAQPATAFNATALGRVFFIGTKFTDRNVAGGDCQSRFDSVLFAVGAVSGSAVYDLDSSGSVTAGEKSFMISGKVNAIRGSLGQIVLDKGEVNPTTAPPAPPAPKEADQTNTGSSGEVFIGKIKPNSMVCR